MRPHLRAMCTALACAALFGAARAPDRTTRPPITSEVEMNRAVAKGTFDVELAAQEAREGQGRMWIDKRYHGDLEGTAEGVMLTWRADGGVPAAYVAIERVTGTLAGRDGSFVLTHTGTMTGDEQHLAIAVVPGSGTGGLSGLSGAMAITIDDSGHHYELEYELEDRP